MSDGSRLHQKKWPWIALFFVMAAAFLALGYVYYLGQIRAASTHEYEKLHAIAELKTKQIQEWRRERMAVLQLLAQSPYFAAAVQEFALRPDAKDLESRLRQRLMTVTHDRRYQDALLVGLDGEILVSAEGGCQELDPSTGQTVKDALSSRRTLVGDFYRCSIDGKIRIDAVAPILGEGDRPVAVLVFRLDPEADLYPLLLSWPIPSRTAETALVRKDGDHALFLNELRHRPGSALKLREPLTNSDLPSVRAVLGKHEHFEGKDYRGVEVLAGVFPILDTPWFMVAKVDKEEMLDEVHREAWLISLLVVMLIILAGVGTGLVFVSRQRLLYANLYRVEKERSETQEELRATLYSIGDAVITTDTGGLVRHMNRVAERLTGWSEADAAGCPLHEVFHIVNEKTREEVENPVQRVLRDGIVVGLANHTVLIAKDGTQHAIADSGAPIRGADGSVLGVVLVFADITEQRGMEEELRNSEEKYRTLFESGTEGFFILSDVFEDCNEQACRLWACTKEDIIGHSPSEFSPQFQPDGRSSEEAGRGYMEAAMGGAPQRFYWKHLRKDGVLIDTEISLKALNLGRRRVLLATLSDITERKRAEAAILRAKNEWERTFDAVPELICILDNNFRIVRLNRAMAEALDLSTQEMVGKTCYKEIHRTDSPPHFCPHLKLLKDGKEHSIEIYDEALGGHFYVTVSPLHDAEGRLEGCVHVARNISDQKALEKTLRESEEKYRTVVQESFDGIFVQKGTVITFANTRLHEMLGYGLGELEGLDHWLIYHPDDHDTVRSRAQARLRGEWAPPRYEVRLLRKDGTSFPGEISAKVILFDKEPGIQVWIRDLTESKRLQEQLIQAQKMEAIGILAGGIAHDFNNLLQVVLGYSELLLADKQGDDHETADLLKIFQAARSGAELVQRLLMFSRKSESKPVPMNLNQKIIQVEKLLRRTIPRMIDIHLDLSPDLPEIYADPSQVEQVLMNLAVNAHDAMAEGGTLTVRTATETFDEECSWLHVEAGPGTYVLLEVSDTGHGMDKDTIEYIFDPFFTTKEMGRGTGLGLAMVHGIVKQHNGYITVYSEVGKGTSFRVYLPAMETEVDTDVETSSEMLAFGTETILVVDDEKFVRDLGTRILAKHGYTVLQAGNGREGLDLFKSELSRISLVILDLIMPEMGGRECFRELLKIDPNVKVLVASGYSADASVREMIQMGAKGFVSKPFRMKEILRTVRRALDECGDCGH